MENSIDKGQRTRRRNKTMDDHKKVQNPCQKCIKQNAPLNHQKGRHKIEHQVMALISASDPNQMKDETTIPQKKIHRTEEDFII